MQLDGRHVMALDQFLRMFEEPDALYFLGAGASHPIVPMAAKLGELVLEQTLALGHYPTTPVPLDLVAERIVGQAKLRLRRVDHRNDDWILRAELAERISPGAVQAAAVGLLHPGKPDRCPQYEVFQLSTYPATLINFNNDGLADAFCTKHVVLTVHGTSLNPQRRQALDWDRLVDSLQMFSALRAPIVPGLLLPQLEPQGIVETTPYVDARRRIMRAKRIALIGYSFGGMDDQVAYRLLTWTVARTRVPIIVVGPDVGDLVMRLREDAPGAPVIGLVARWYALAEAIIASSLRRFHKSCDTGRLCSRCVAYVYEAILDESWWATSLIASRTKDEMRLVVGKLDADHLER
jgi:hypothetical protein